MTSLISKKVLMLISVPCLILFYYCSLYLGYIQADGITLSIAKDIHDGTYPQAMTGFLHSIFFAKIVSLLFPFFHEPLWLPRSVTKAAGVLCVSLTFFFTKKVYNDKVALAASLLFATSLWHYRITHSGQEFFTPLFTVATLYAYVLFIHSGKLRYLALCGIFVAFGILSQPVVSALLLALFFHAWTSAGLKKAVKHGAVLLAASGATLSPVACHAMINRAAFEKEIYYYVFLGKPAMEFRMFLARGFFTETKENFLEFVRGAAFCLSPNSSAPHLFYSVPFLLFICSMIYFFVVAGRRKSRTGDNLLVFWLAVCAFTLTFLAPWTSSIRFPQSSAAMRTPWYYSIFFPLPYIMTAKMLCDAYASIAHKFRYAFLVPLILVFVQNIHGVTALFHPAENLERDAYAHIFRYATQDTFLMSNIPPADYTAVKNFSYFLKPSKKFIEENFADLESLYSINAVYPAFMYQSQASKTLLLSHPVPNSGNFWTNFLSFEALPIFPISLLKQFESVSGEKIKDVYFLLYQGNCNGALFCVMDYLPFSNNTDLPFFRMLNPDMTPVKTLAATASRNKIEIYHFKILERKYTKIRFSFHKKGSFLSLQTFPVSNGNIYLPWIGFGWKHNVGLRFENFETAGARETVLGAILKNTFSVDVVPGEYAIKAILYKKPSSALPEIIIENTAAAQNQLAVISGKEEWEKIKLAAVVDVKDHSFDITFAPREKSHRQWGIKELEIRKL